MRGIPNNILFNLLFYNLNNYKYAQFFFEVMPGAPTDIKNNSEWYHPLYIFNNEIIDVDAIGNILYGWLGAYMNISKNDLLIGADIAQFSNVKNINSFKEVLLYGDDERDQDRILQGI